MDGAGRFRSTVAADTARERKLPEKLLQSNDVFALVGIDLGIASVQIYRSEYTRCAMAGTGYVNHVQIIFFDNAVQLRPHKGLPGTGSPVAQKAKLDMLNSERLPQQRILSQIQHSENQIATGAPVRVYVVQFFPT